MTFVNLWLFFFGDWCLQPSTLWGGGNACSLMRNMNPGFGLLLDRLINGCRLLMTFPESTNLMLLLLNLTDVWLGFDVTPPAFCETFVLLLVIGIPLISLFFVGALLPFIFALQKLYVQWIIRQTSTGWQSAYDEGSYSKGQISSLTKKSFTSIEI